MPFRARLQELREAANLTQAELAERAGMSKGGIANLEQGLRQPEWETVQRLADALGVSCEAFKGGSEEGKADETPKRGRGRPAKAKEEDAAPAVKRGRGRPKKEKE